MKCRIILFLLITIISLNVHAQKKDNINEAFKQNSFGYSLIQKGDYKNSIYYFNKAIALDSLNSIFYQNRAYAKAMLKDYHGALSDYLTLSRMYPLEPGYYYEIGNYLQDLNLYDSAIVNYTKAINLIKPKEKIEDFYLYYFNRGYSNWKLQKFEMAISDFDTVISSKPEHYPSYFNRGISKYSLKQKENGCFDILYAYNMGYSEANSYLEKYCSEYKDKIKILKKDTTILDSIKTPPIFKGGDKALVQFIAENVKYPTNAVQNGEYGKVILRFTVFNNAEVGDFEVINSISPVLDNEAIRVIQSTRGKWIVGKINSDPADVSITINVMFQLSGNESIDNLKKNGIINFNKGNYKEAIAYFNEILKENPFDYEVLLKRALAKEKIGDVQGAISDRKKINMNMSPIYLKSYKSETQISDNILSDYVKIYYDSIWQITKKNSAYFFRNAKWNYDSHYFDGEFTDYDMNNNKIAQGNYSNKKRSGNFIFYYPNGQIKIKATFLNNEPIGTWKFFYDNGKSWQTVVFENNDFKVNDFMSFAGDTLINNSNGKWNYIIETYTKTDNLILTGSFSKGKRDGTWIVEQGNKIILDESYNNGRFKKGTSYDAGNIQKTFSTSIANWIFIPYFLPRIENFIFSKEASIKDYFYIESR